MERHGPGTPIAVVDDEESVRRALQRLIRAAGREATTFASGREFLESAAATRFACVVLDLHMPQMNGFDVQALLADRAIAVPVIFITGHDTPGARERAIDQGASAYLCKPIDERLLMDAIAVAIAGSSRHTL